MPYIKDKQKEELISIAPRNCGELTYRITELLNAYLLDKGLSYQSITEIKGSILGAYDDFQDRVVNIYEKKKRLNNGDVWNHRFTL